MRSGICFLVFLLFLQISPLHAQRTAVYDENLRYYNRALELFNKEKYAVAQKHFLLYTQITSDRETKINAEYYAGVCAMELFNADAINLLSGIFLKYPEHSKAQPAIYQLGKYFYRTKDNRNAIKYFEQTNPVALTFDEADEYWFMKGYCYFKIESFDESKNAFQNIKDKQGKYYDASNYYYGYVAYKQGNQQEALEHFMRSQKSKVFGPLSHVYIAQIYFSRKQYREVVQLADTISVKETATDIAGIVGQSYYHLHEFDKAIPYLVKYAENPPVAKSSQDIYRLGYSYYQTGEYEKAISLFGEIATNKDTVSQYANIHLAEAYLKTGNKQKARNAFDVAYRNGSIAELTEVALFHFARLSFELGLQQDALKDLVKFVNTYPASKHIDEAKTSLGDLLLNTKNYKDAIIMIESIKAPTQDNKIAYQRVCYYRAEELYLNNDYPVALETFNKSIKYDFDKKLFALAHFWIAELNYKSGQYDAAFEIYNKFSMYPDIKETRFYFLASYNRGYCRLKVEQYENAIAEFNKFLATDYAKTTPELLTDATMRVADCNFVLREYNKAIEYYDIIINKKLNGSDYALYQKAMILGVQNKSSEKIDALTLITHNYKRSPYIDDALFEIANVNLQNENYQEALNGFQSIIDVHPNSVYIRKAMLNKGLANYNQNRDDDALSAFKDLITKHPKSQEAREALVVIKNIFVNKGQADEYIDFIKVLPNVVVSPSYQDSVTYESAFNMYKNSDCVKASKGFGNYIHRFQGGFFFLKANYYKAECDFKLKNYDSALICYEYVATYNRNDFTEKATRQTAVLHYMKKNYEKAFAFYASLERIASTREHISAALLGQLKSAGFLNRVDTAATVGQRYLNSTIVQKDGIVEARFFIAKNHIRKMEADSALPHFQFVLKETKNSWAAESKYQISYINYLKKDYKTAKKQIFELADNYSSYEYWVAKGFLLLADIYLIEKDNFQAKATLQSLIENYEGEDLKQEAQNKMSRIIADEDALKQKQVKPEEDKEINQQ